jgi:hypothetical protein
MAESEGGGGENQFSAIVKDDNTAIFSASNPIFKPPQSILDINIAEVCVKIFFGKVKNMESCGSDIFSLKPPNTPPPKPVRNIDEFKSGGLMGSGGGGGGG